MKTELQMDGLVSFSFPSMVRRYHVYVHVWDASVAEELPCRRETDNYADPFAVAVIKSENIVGHVPRNISTVCSLFLRRGGSITCHVTGHRRYSRDLPQGGVEIPCTLVFQGNSKYVEKAKNLLTASKAPFTTSKTIDKVESSSTGDTATSDHIPSGSAKRITN